MTLIYNASELVVIILYQDRYLVESGTLQSFATMNLYQEYPKWLRTGDMGKASIRDSRGR